MTTPATRLLERLVERAGTDAKALLAELERHGIPPTATADAVARLAPVITEDEAWRAAVTADRAREQRMGRALAVVEHALGPVADAVTISRSPLGAAWGRDVDVLVRSGRLADAEAALLSAGFPSIDPLLARLGIADAGLRYAVIDGADALTSVELTATKTTDRLRRQAAKAAAARRPAARHALELAALAQERGADEVRAVAVVALRRCARLERDLGVSGPATELARGLAPRPNLAWPRARLDNLGLRLGRLRARRLVVAFSGIDGSGKSTQAALLGSALERLGVPATTVWGRIGFSGSRLLDNVAGLVRRFLPAGSHSAQRARAEGLDAGAGKQPLTRRGPLGWSWALAVTLEYLRQVRGQIRRARGRVVVLDRTLSDALVDLEQGFGGELRLGLHRRLVQRLAPRADIIFYLRISGAAAVARKDDFFAANVLQAYADRLDALAPSLGAVVVDAERPPEEIAHDALLAVLAT